MGSTNIVARAALCEGARMRTKLIDKSMGLIVQGIEMDLMHPFDEPEFNRLGRYTMRSGRLKTLRLTIISNLAATSLATTTRVSWNSDDAALCDTDRPRRFHVCRGWALNLTFAAPTLGNEFPILPKASHSLSTWELQPGPEPRSYSRDDIDRIGVSSLFELLKWDGVLDVNSGWGPWVGDGLVSMVARPRVAYSFSLMGILYPPQMRPIRRHFRVFACRLTRVDIFVGSSTGFMVLRDVMS